MHLETKTFLPLLALGLLGLAAQDVAAQDAATQDAATQKENHDRNHDPLREAVKLYESRIDKLESLFNQLLAQRQQQPDQAAKTLERVTQELHSSRNEQQEKDRALVKMAKELAEKEQLLRDHESKIQDLSTKLQQSERSLEEYQDSWAKAHKSLQLTQQRAQQQDVQIEKIEQQLASLGRQLAGQQPQPTRGAGEVLATDLEKQLAEQGIHIHNAGGTIIIQVGGGEPEAQTKKR